MKFTSDVKVVGMKGSKGEFEGTRYDSTKVYVETSLDESKGTAKGVSTVEYSFGTAEEFEKFKHLPFPFMAAADMEIVTTGKAQKTVMLGLKPKSQVKQAA